MLHVMGAQCVARDLHTIAPGPLERTCWRQFAAQWGDCKKSRIAPLNAIIIIIINLVVGLPPLSSACLFFPFCQFLSFFQFIYLYVSHNSSSLSSRSPTLRSKTITLEGHTFNQSDQAVSRTIELGLFSKLPLSHTVWIGHFAVQVELIRDCGFLTAQGWLQWHYRIKLWKHNHIHT